MGTYQWLRGGHAGTNYSLYARSNPDVDRRRAFYTGPTNAQANSPVRGASHGATTARNCNPHAHVDGAATAANDSSADNRSSADGTANGTADACAGAWPVHPGRQRYLGHADNYAIQPE